MRHGFRLWVPGKPRPGGRPRFSRTNAGRVITRKDERDIPARTAITMAWMQAGRPTVDGLWAILVHAEVPRFKTHWTATGELSAAGRRVLLPPGDVDNYGKLSMDALVKARAIPDDQYCMGMLATKAWAPGRDHPGLLTIEIQPAGPAPADVMPSIAWTQIDAAETPAAAA